MSGIQVFNFVLNQLDVPAFYAAPLADRPGAGFAGRIFVDTDTPSTGMYRDTGTDWEQVAVAVSNPGGPYLPLSGGTLTGIVNSLSRMGIGVVPHNAALEVVELTGEIFRADGAGGALRIVADQDGVIFGGLIRLLGAAVLESAVDMDGLVSINSGADVSGGLTADHVLVQNSTGEVFRVDAAAAALRIVADQDGVQLGGIVTAPTPEPADDSTRLATTAFVQDALPNLSGYAPLNSPVFTGTPTAPTPSTADNTTRIATTAFVNANAIVNQTAGDQSASFRISGSGRIGTTLRVVGAFQCDDNATVQGFISVGTNQDAVWAGTFNNQSPMGKGVTISGGGGSDYSLLVNDYSGSFRFGVQADGNVASAGVITSGSGFAITGSSAERVLLGDGQLGYIKRFSPFGDGISTVISFAHGMSGISSASPLTVMANNANAAGIQWAEVDGSGNINVYYATPPPADELLLTVMATPV